MIPARVDNRFRRSWSAADAALLGVLIVVAIWTARSALLDIWSRATSDAEQSHILLVPVVAGWLVWLRRSRLRFVRYQPNLYGPAIVFLGWLLIWSGYHMDLRVSQHVGALLMLVGSVVSMAGLSLVRQFLAAFLVLAFAIPIPGVVRHAIAEPLQTMATVVTHEFLTVFGVASVRSGNLLEIHGQQVAVGEACNGMRMVFALALVVFAFVFSTPFRFSTRVFLLVLSPIVALVCNVIRLVPTSLIYGFGDPESAEMFHDLAGWLMLPIALLVLVGVLRLVRWLQLPLMSWRLAGGLT